MRRPARLGVGPLAIVLVAALAVWACDYVVVPPEESAGTAVNAEGWSAVPTAIGPGEDGALRIDLAIENDTKAWSTIEAARGAARLRGADGSTTDCPTVVVGTGGHRLPPGFRMRGFVGGTKAKPAVETLRVECPGVTGVSPGAKLALDTTFWTGDFNYYDEDATRTERTIEVDLDKVATDLTYPVAIPVDGLILPASTPITAINDVVLTLADAVRTDDGMEMTWQASNPGEYPSAVHIGQPPVIGADGILYGRYESPDIAEAPLTPPGGKETWTTTVAVPPEVGGLIVPLSVESQARYFVNYALDLSDR
jgi:hypothetical protein